MLNGIGGRTIEEAKERLTYAEVQTWMRYRQMRGSLFFGNRIESSVGVVSHIVHRAAGGKSELEDFLPHADKKQPDIRDFFKAIGG